jgi:hypothetical protein
MYECKLPDKEGKEFKRLSKFYLLCSLNDNADVVNPVKKKDERATAAPTHLLFIKGKIPHICNIRLSSLGLILLANEKPSLCAAAPQFIEGFG